MDFLGGVAGRVRMIAPAIVVDGDMQGLRGVADVVAPDANIAKRQLLAKPAIGFEPSPLLRGGRCLGALHRSAPIGEVLPDLLPAVDDRVRQVAGAVLRKTAGPELRIIGLPRRR